jgi:hypothetical protein
MKKLLTYKAGVVSILKGNFMLIGDDLSCTHGQNWSYRYI